MRSPSRYNWGSFPHCGLSVPKLSVVKGQISADSVGRGVVGIKRNHGVSTRTIGAVSIYRVRQLDSLASGVRLIFCTASPATRNLLM